MKTDLALPSFWLFLARLGNQAGLAVFTILVAQRLGSEGFGEYAFIAAVVMVGNMLTTFGTDMHLIRQIAASGDLKPLFSALILQIGLSMCFVTGLYLLSSFDHLHSPVGITALKIYSLSLFPLAFFTVFTTALRGKQQMSAFALLNAGLALMQVIAAGIFYFLNSGLADLAWLLLFIQMLAAAFAGILCLRTIPSFWQEWRFSWRDCIPLIQAAAPIAMLSILTIFYQRLSLILLPFLSGSGQTGLFSAAARIVEITKAGHIAVFTILYPMMAQKKHQQVTWLRSFNRPLLGLLGGAGLLALAMFFLSEPLIHGLFGTAYLASISVIQILCWVLLPYTMNTFLSLVLLAEGREALVTQTMLASLLVLAILTAWWGQTTGAHGAAGAVIAAEVFQSATLAWQMARTHGWSFVKSRGLHEFPHFS